MSILRTELLSVIVPIYNTELFLPKCIESITNQTYDNLEIILVDDGSIDGSARICDRYAKKDKRIKVLHKKNEGLLKARKDGVLFATGDVITFVDSDDWIENGIYERMMGVFSNGDFDLLSAGILRHFESNGKSDIVYDNYPQGAYNELDMEIYPTMLWDYRCNGYGLLCNLCTKLFKTEILRDVFCKINTDIFYGEDCYVFYNYCLKSKKIFIMHEAGYHYIIRDGSMCRSADVRLINNAYLLYTELRKAFMSYQNPYILMRQLKKYMLEIVEKHTLKMLYDIDLSAFCDWQFDYNISIFNKDYIIYGAGTCGQALYRMLSKNGKVQNMVAWVDKNPGGKGSLCPCGIISADKLTELQYDHIVIAVKDIGLANQIRKELINTYHVFEDKILWEASTEGNEVFPGCVF